MFKLTNINNDNVFYLSDDIKLDNEHKYSEHTEVESEIIEILVNDDFYLLLCVNLIKNIDVLHIKEYKTYILLNLTKNKIEDKLEYIDNDIEQSIIVKNNVPQIWYKNIKI